MVQPGQLTELSDLLAVIQTQANSKASMPHRPFAVETTRDDLNDRGSFVFGNTYSFPDKVDWMGYTFIANGQGLTAPPLDPETRNPNPGWTQPWQDCYQRVRDSLNEAVVKIDTGIPQWEQSVSGPWPCQNPSIYYNHIEFYYPDTGQQERVIIGGAANPATVFGKFSPVQTEIAYSSLVAPPGGTLSASTPVVASGGTDPGNTYTLTAVTGPATAEHEGQFLFEYSSSSEFTIAIGGTKPLTINATFRIFATAKRGVTIRTFATVDGSGSDVVPDPGDDPSGLVTVDAGKFLPGVTFDRSFTGWANVAATGNDLDQNVYGGTIILTATVNGTFQPGVYVVSVSSTAAPNNQAGGQLKEMFPSDGSPSTTSGAVSWHHDTFVDVGSLMLINGTCGLIATDTFEVPGIHDTKKVFKIPAPPFNPATDIPTGIWGGQAAYRQTIPDPGASSPFFIGGAAAGELTEAGNPNPLIFVKLIYDNQFGLAVSASTQGFWFAVTPPVRSLGLIPFAQMPWNIFPTTATIGNFGEPQDNGYLGYKPPYLFGTLSTGSFGVPAYSADGPAWVPPGSSNELLPWPKRWKALAHYPFGYCIMDSHGNLQRVDLEGRSGRSEPGWTTTPGDLTTEPDLILPPHATDKGVRWKLYKVLNHAGTIKRDTAYTLGQTLRDDNGNKQTVTVAGITGTDTPDWNKASLGLTVDGTVTWQLTRFDALQPAVAHITPTIYPCFWKNPAAGQSDPPPVLTNTPVNDAGVHVFDFKPQGWWIYRVAINKIPQARSTDKPSDTPVSVTIGCIRNGAFVAFGTYHTGQVIDAYWPIFTNTALCYTASERVDIQAAILTCGTNYSTWGHVDAPFAATYLNDVETLLGKIQ